MRIFFFISLIFFLKAGHFPDKIIVRQDQLLEEQKDFYRKQLDILSKQPFYSNEQFIEIKRLFYDFLSFAYRPFLKKNIKATMLLKFAERVAVLESKTNNKIVKSWLAGMKVVYLSNEYNTSDFRFINSLSFVSIDSHIFIKFLTFKSLFNLRPYFPDGEWMKTYDKVYLESLISWVEKVNEQNIRVVFHEIKFFIKNHLKLLTNINKKRFMQFVNKINHRWLKNALTLEIILLNNHFSSLKTKSKNLLQLKKSLMEDAKGKTYLPESMTLAIKLHRYLYSSINYHKLNKYFRLALKQEFNYLPLYQAYYNYLTNEERFIFLLECVLTKRFETFIPSLLWFFPRNFVKGKSENLSEMVLQGYEKAKNSFFNNKKFLYSHIFNYTF